MSDEIKVIRGTKISPEEAKTLDRAKMGVLLSGSAHDAGEVEGQDWVRKYVECPWEGCITRAWIDTEAYHWYTCGVCGGPMRL